MRVLAKQQRIPSMFATAPSLIFAVSKPTAPFDATWLVKRQWLKRLAHCLLYHTINSHKQEVGPC
jgi:hypothetical protein